MKTALTIYDTTLRDGTQGGGISFSALDKIRVAQALDEFGVHYIEGGWPGSNPKDIEFFQEAAKLKWKNSKIAAFGSTRRVGVKVEDDEQVRKLLEANTPVVTIYGKTWRLHVEEVLRTTVEENLKMIYETVAFLKQNGKEVIYDAEHFFDGFKDDPEHAISTLKAAADAGADLLALCDTNGGTLPEEVAQAVESVKKQISTPIGMHTHDDSGLGVANALAGIRAGATQVQGTINGYGERVGNCNLTTVIPNLQLKMKLPVVPHLERLSHLSHFVDDLANASRFPRAPFVGINAFAHKGGTHVNAVQKLARSYEHIEPESVGNRQNILVSELSGQSNVMLKAEKMGIHFEKNDPSVKTILSRIKDLEKEGFEYEAADASLELLIKKELNQLATFFELLEFHTTHRYHQSSGFNTCEATVKLKVNEQRIYTVEEGDGPVNALDNALRKALLPFYPQIADIALADYKVRIIDGSSGTSAKTRVLITSRHRQEYWTTVGVSDNIIDASWQALTEGIIYYLSK
jgi:2-isopropylmalate synthase